MRCPLRIKFYILLIPLLSSCAPVLAPPTHTSLVLYRFDPPAFLEYSEDFQLTKEIPFSIPPNCSLFNTFSAPIGPSLLIELSCPNGQTVLYLDIESASVTQPFSNADSHFLAWTSDGKSAYLKIDSLGSAQIVRIYTDGKQDILTVSEFTYDLAAKPDSNDFTFTFSRGLGYGSELHFAQHDGRISTLIYADQYNYISFARFSPDGSQIIFIKTPDTQMPFTVGELWIMNADGTNVRKLADADAGHGYAATWSADGTRIAFVMRENPKDQGADQASEALKSNIYIVDVNTGTLTRITQFTEGRVETPYWSPSGNTLVFNRVLNGRMTVSIADVTTGKIKPFETDAVCCPAWMRK